MNIFEELENIEKHKIVTLEETGEDFCFINVQEKTIKTNKIKNEIDKSEKVINKEYILSKNELHEFKKNNYKIFSSDQYMVLPKGIKYNLKEYIDLMIETKSNIIQVLEDNFEESANYPLTFSKNNDYEVIYKINKSLVLSRKKEIIPQPVLLGYLDGMTEDYFNLEELIEFLKNKESIYLIENENNDYIFKYMNLEKGEGKNYILFIIYLDEKKIEKINKYFKDVGNLKNLESCSNKQLTNLLIKSKVLN